MEQKVLFEASADRLPYVECQPYGKSGPKTGVCIANMINAYPTWIIKGRRYKGLLTTKRLVALSGYTGPVNQETRK